MDLQVCQARLDHRVLKVIVESVHQESQVLLVQEAILALEARWVQLEQLVLASNALQL